MLRNVKCIIAFVLCIALFVGFGVPFAVSVDFSENSELSEIVADQGFVAIEEELELTGDAITGVYIDNEGLTQVSLDYEEIEIPLTVFDNEETAGRTEPIITGYVYEVPVAQKGKTPSTNSYGVGTPMSRITTWMNASNGIIEKGNALGIFSSVASIPLAFVPGIPAMIVSAVLGGVGLVTSSSQAVQAKTFVSYRYLYRDGEAKFSSDAYYSVYVRTGRRETYQHLLGAREDPTTLRWTTYTYDYQTPSLIENSPHYLSSNAWLLNDAKERLLTQLPNYETVW